MDALAGPSLLLCVCPLWSGHSLLGDAGAQFPPSRHPGCPPAATVPPQPKGTFTKQPPLPRGAPRMPWLPEELIKPSAAINSAEERAR